MCKGQLWGGQEKFKGSDKRVNCRGEPRYIFINISVSATAEVMTGCVASQNFNLVILGYSRVYDSHVINLKFPLDTGVARERQGLMFSGGWKAAPIKGTVTVSSWVMCASCENPRR